MGRERGNGRYEVYQYCYRQNFFQTALDQSDSIRASRTKSSSNSSLKIASIRRQGQGEEGQNQTQATISNQWKRKKRFPEKRLPRKTIETIKTVREMRKLSHKPSVPPSLGDFLGFARALHLFQVQELLPHGVHEVVEVVLQALGRFDGKAELDCFTWNVSRWPFFPSTKIKRGRKGMPSREEESWRTEKKRKKEIPSQGRNSPQPQSSAPHQHHATRDQSSTPSSCRTWSRPPLVPPRTCSSCALPARSGSTVLFSCTCTPTSACPGRRLACARTGWSWGPRPPGTWVRLGWRGWGWGSAGGGRGGWGGGGCAFLL